MTGDRAVTVLRAWCLRRHQRPFPWSRPRFRTAKFSGRNLSVRKPGPLRRAHAQLELSSRSASRIALPFGASRGKSRAISPSSRSTLARRRHVASERGVGARASRPLPWEKPSSAPKHVQAGAPPNLDAARLATLRSGEGAQGRRLWLTPRAYLLLN